MWQELSARLEGRLIVLDPVRAEQEEALRTSAADPVVWRWMQVDASTTAGTMRVEFKTDARNVESRRALEALPASFEGIFRKHMLIHAGIRDSAYYAIVDDDWPQVKANLERRLKAKY